MTKAMNLNDMGGTYIDHMFGAYFGLAVSWMLGVPEGDPTMGYIPDIFSLIGTIFLWIYWPSFIAGAAEPNSVQQQRALVHTIISLSSSTVCTFWFSSVLNPDKKFRPVDIQNATLAGGVAIGCVANLDVGGVGACMVGCAAGLVSTFGYNIIQPYLEKNFKLHDTCGIHNLHGMPSVIGAISSVLAAAHHMDKDIYGDTYKDQPWLQLLAIPFCIGFAIISGLITGFFITKLSPKLPEADIKEFQDIAWWTVADDYDRSLYSELALLVGNKDVLNKSISKSLSEFSSHHGRRPHQGDDVNSFPLSKSAHNRSSQNISELDKV
jgi:ammonium transporter Rh